MWINILRFHDKKILGNFDSQCASNYHGRLIEFILVFIIETYSFLNCRKLQQRRHCHRVNSARRYLVSVPNTGCSSPGLEDRSWQMAKSRRRFQLRDFPAAPQVRRGNRSAWVRLSRAWCPLDPRRYTKSDPATSITSAMVLYLILWQFIFIINLNRQVLNLSSIIFIIL